MAQLARRASMRDISRPRMTSKSDLLDELVSACCANVFLLLGARLSTPHRSSGARTGVIREWVIARRKVEERRLRREDATSADEIFPTNSWLGVQPVATLEGRPLGPRATGPRLAAELAARRA